MTAPFKIGTRAIGPSEPPFILAEISGNHNGSLDRALELVDAAAAAGADGVKLQTYTADTITIDYDGPGFVLEDGLWKGRRLYELYQEAHTPWEWHQALFDRAKKAGITIFSSPFDPTAVDFLNGLGAPAFKIASFEIVDLPLIKKAASTGKPLVISTGIASLTEIGEAVSAAQSAGEGGVMLLHCVSGYPTPTADANLATMADLEKRFGAPVGLSDHTLGTAVPVAAVARGACLIEKHLTLRRADGGPDAEFSLEPDELARLVRDCRDAWAAVGRVNYEREASEEPVAHLRRSLYVVNDIPAGGVLSHDNIRSIRPGYGLAPKYLDNVLGRRAKHALKRGTPLAMKDLQ